MMLNINCLIVFCFIEERIGNRNGEVQTYLIIGVF
jgi:hypothetical protein